MTEINKDTARRSTSETFNANLKETELKEITLNNFKLKDSIVFRWSCDICGGDDDSGCLYFDPSECPKRN